MSLPWLPEELSFIAEEELLVDISPHFSCPTMKFMSGEYGPFAAGRPARVPLWLGLFLSSSQSCTLIAPKWLNISSLKKLVKKERDNPDILTHLPGHGHYLPLSFAFFTRAPSTVKDVDQVRNMIEDLWAVRVEKLRRMITTSVSDGSQDAGSLTNATRMEIHLFREPITKITDLWASLPQRIDDGA